MLLSLDASVGVRLGDDGLPKDVLLWRNGDNLTTKGTFKLTDRSRKLVMADWEARMGGVVSPSGDGPGSFDFDHDEFNDNLPGYQKISAGSFHLALDGKDFWLTGCGFTELAAGQIKKKEKRSTSGAFYFDPKTGEFTSLINCALTNLPATYKQPLLANGHGRAGVGIVYAPPDGPQEERRVIVQVPALVFAGDVTDAQKLALSSALDLLGQGKLEDAGRALLGAPSEPAPAPIVPDSPAAPAATKTSPETTSMHYQDPNFVGTYHGYMLRYMASCDMESMMTAIYLNGELPKMSAAMELSKYCEALAANVMHCAGALAECMQKGAEDGDDESMDEASQASLIAKTPESLKAKVEEVLAACKAAKLGGLLQKAHKAALAAVDAKTFDKTALSALSSLGKDLPTMRASAVLVKRVMVSLDVKSEAEIIPALTDKNTLLEQTKQQALTALSAAGADVKVARATAIAEMLSHKHNGKDAPLITPADAQLAQGLDPVEGKPTGLPPYSLEELSLIKQRALARLNGQAQGQSSAVAGLSVAPVPTPAPAPLPGAITSTVGSDQALALVKAMCPDVKPEMVAESVKATLSGTQPHYQRVGLAIASPQ